MLRLFKTSGDKRGGPRRLVEAKSASTFCRLGVLVVLPGHPVAIVPPARLRPFRRLGHRPSAPGGKEECQLSPPYCDLFAERPQFPYNCWSNLTR
jgi:hypothetical protein